MTRWLSLLLVAVSATTAFADTPNIVFILADDLGVNDLGCYGRKEHKTPHLNKLAAEGMRFTNAYAACPVCSPTRAAILTGLHPARLRITTFLPGRGDAPSQKLLHPKINQQLPLEAKTLAEYLKGAGYTTACIGKWHLGGANFGPKPQGFDFVYAGKPNTTPSETEGGKGEFDLATKANEFIAANKDKPFFLYLAHNTPHIPLAAKKELVAKYKDAFNPVYAAIIEEMDTSVGRVLAKLDELKLADKTIVVFTSDNGGVHVPELKEDPPTHNTPWRAGKGFLYEGGIRVPLIVRWPGRVKPGSTSDVPAISTDWTPTLLNAAKLMPDANLDGVSLLRALEGQSVPTRNLFWHIPHYTNQGSRPSGAIRSGNTNWKLIVNYEDGSHELYNLTADPGETRDISNSRPGIAQSLRQQFDTWLKSVDAQSNEPNPAFDKELHRKLYRDTDVSTLKPKATAALTAEPLRDWRKSIDEVVRSKK
jgi:arylsulfatase A